MTRKWRWLTLIGVAVSLHFSGPLTAQQPLDGQYQGNTSQGEMISFTIDNGEIRSLLSTLIVCTAQYPWEYHISAGNFHGNYFVVSRGVVTDAAGLPVSVIAKWTLPIYIIGTFETATRAAGQIAYVLPYLTGDGFNTDYCVETDVTFVAERLTER